jgi:hypothetical protein
MTELEPACPATVHHHTALTNNHKTALPLHQGFFCVFWNVEILAPQDFGTSIFWRHSSLLMP